MKRREDWFEGQLDLDPEHLVFIDETPLGLDQHGSPIWAGAARPEAAHERPPWPLENDDFRRRAPTDGE